MVEFLGITVCAVGAGFICARMPLTERTIQPHGIMHGGAFVTLAESLGSLASALLVARTEGARVAGVEVSGSHLRAVNAGVVTGICRPLRIGRTLHVWAIDIRDADGRLCSSCRLTVSISQPGGKA
ncbi:MAG: hotdog fold thioesterase [Xanthomonadales bacterium]|nr:hotdog fold thioesterase [Xanthomonadales bacterium]NIN60087.1 hotdog fold thioesterase [Xanthomonadales bacterium]NIN75457.1 hotdog fold thioesterase [Xanthomonadales bacterium]NIO13553.1 hotdog fold thioesterase [Xanthomonadales bacterium]NIP12480.1 hotdog fold thioesterase [Xanthomonadales bacterium]